MNDFLDFAGFTPVLRVFPAKSAYFGFTSGLHSRKPGVNQVCRHKWNGSTGYDRSYGIEAGEYYEGTTFICGIYDCLDNNYTSNGMRRTRYLEHDIWSTSLTKSNIVLDSPTLWKRWNQNVHVQTPNKTNSPVECDTNGTMKLHDIKGWLELEDHSVGYQVNGFCLRWGRQSDLQMRQPWIELRLPCGIWSNFQCMQTWIGLCLHRWIQGDLQWRQTWIRLHLQWGRRSNLQWRQP